MLFTTEVCYCDEMILEVNISTSLDQLSETTPYIEGCRDVIDDETASLRQSYTFCMCQDFGLFIVATTSKVIFDLKIVASFERGKPTIQKRYLFGICIYRLLKQTIAIYTDAIQHFSPRFTRRL